ncbi:site-specific integrase [Halomicroarcula sp. S1AR25-4]|uniref:tyrosine-type recombinase/integrase n=1 Tax=Haloarcula sp. S1AR25-4 TaxID=2950538 RepID=UPI002874D562|nr:site-specific integrase [Halomicroarcula sp. S1AR25-4]MDS0279362.1 site-specific integrase [Halomicroarcula sp. S1AR25-4]
MSDDLDPITPEAALDYYLDARQYDLADATLSGHKYRLKSFVRWLTSEDYGDGEIVNMNDVDLRAIHAYRVFKREENFPEEDPCNAVSMQGQVSTLRVFFQHLADIKGVPSDFHERIRLPKLQEGEDVDERVLDAERANAILDHLRSWEYATPHHIAFLIFWRTSCRTGGLRALDVEDFDPDEGALAFRHRPKEGTPLKNNMGGERDVSLKPHVAGVIEDYISGPHRDDVTDEYGRNPLITTREGRASAGTIRNWMYFWTQPCRLGEKCPEGRDPDECEATDLHELSKCPVAFSPHPIRSGSITAHRDAGTPRTVVSGRGDVSEKTLEKHYDRASKRERMRRRRDHIPDDI